MFPGSPILGQLFRLKPGPPFSRQPISLLLGFRTDYADGCHRARFRGKRRRLELLPVGRQYFFPIPIAHEMTEYISGSELGCIGSAAVVRAKHPYFRRRRRNRACGNRLPVQPIAVRQQLGQSLERFRHLSDIFQKIAAQGDAHMSRSPGRPADSQVYPSGPQCGQKPEGLRHFHRRIMRQQKRSRSEANPMCPRSNIGQQHFGRRAGQMGEIMMLRRPVTMIP